MPDVAGEAVYRNQTYVNSLLSVFNFCSWTPPCLPAHPGHPGGTTERMINSHQARDFRGALEQAEITGRPVRFLRWGYELPVLSLEELSRRNVCRFASTGRCVGI